MLASRPSYPADWEAISGATESVAYVTQEEARQLIAELDAVIGRYQDRFANPGRRPADSLPLEILLFTYPLDAARPGR